MLSFGVIEIFTIVKNFEPCLTSSIEHTELNLIYLKQREQALHYRIIMAITLIGHTDF